MGSPEKNDMGLKGFIFVITQIKEIAYLSSLPMAVPALDDLGNLKLKKDADKSYSVKDDELV